MNSQRPKRILILGDSFCTGVNNLLPLNQKISTLFLLSRLLIALAVYIPAVLVLNAVSAFVSWIGGPKKLVRKLKWTRQYLFWHFNQHWLSNPSRNCFTALIEHIRSHYHSELEIVQDAGIYRFIVDLKQRKLQKLFQGPPYDYIFIYLGINDVGQCVPDDAIRTSIKGLALAIKGHSPSALVGFVEQPNLYYHVTSQRLQNQNYLLLPGNRRLTPAQLDKMLGGINNAPIFRNSRPEDLKATIFKKLKVVDNSYQEEFNQRGIHSFMISNFIEEPEDVDGYSSLFSLDCFHPSEEGYAVMYGKNSISAFEKRPGRGESGSVAQADPAPML